MSKKNGEKRIRFRDIGKLGLLVVRPMLHSVLKPFAGQFYSVSKPVAVAVVNLRPADPRSQLGRGSPRLGEWVPGDHASTGGLREGQLRSRQDDSFSGINSPKVSEMAAEK